MTNSHSEKPLKIEGDQWRPVNPPGRGEDRTAFHAFMLLPGFSISFYSAVLSRSRSSIANYRAAAIKAARLDLAIVEFVNSAVCAISAEDGLEMARQRGKAQLPSWSRLAMREFSKRGFTHREIAAAFRCSPGTAANVLQGKGTSYALFSGARRLTHAQRNPPGKWRSSLAER